MMHTDKILTLPCGREKKILKNKTSKALAVHMDQLRDM